MCKMPSVCSTIASDWKVQYGCVENNLKISIPVYTKNKIGFPPSRWSTYQRNLEFWGHRETLHATYGSKTMVQKRNRGDYNLLFSLWISIKKDRPRNIVTSQR